MKYLFTLILCFRFTNALAGDSAWHLESDRGGVRVLSRSVEGSPILGFRGEGVLPFPPETIYKVLANPEEFHLWMPLVSGSRVIETRSPVSKLVYIHIKMPWPVKDRFFINLGEVETKADGSQIFEIKSVPAPFNEADKIEGWTTRSMFLLKAGPTPGTSYVEIEFNQDPRGTLPKWMVNWAQSAWPRRFFSYLTAYINKPGEKAN